MVGVGTDTFVAAGRWISRTSMPKATPSSEEAVAGTGLVSQNGSGTPEPANLGERLEAEMARRRQLEQELDQTRHDLQESRDQFQAVLDAVPGGVSWINADLKYLGINSRLAANYHL